MTAPLAGAAVRARPTHSFDPANPFAVVTSAQQWLKHFVSGKPHIVVNDRFGNTTSAEFWRNSWQGQNIACPWHDVAVFKKLKDWTVAPAIWNECVSTNNIYMDLKGTLQERVPGDPGYRDIADPRPWSTAYSYGMPRIRKWQPSGRLFSRATPCV